MKLKHTATSLHGKLGSTANAPSCVLRLTADRNAASPQHSAFLANKDDELPSGFAAILGKGPMQSELSQHSSILSFALPEELQYLEDGDIVRLNPIRGEVWVMYRKRSHSNAMLVTERCNSWCIMCSQPPKRADDVAIALDWLKAIPMMAPSTQALGITGGEPTLLGDLFLEIVTKCQDYLPNTALHILSNGRNFAYMSLANSLAAIGHQDLMIGIPLYSDIAWRHEFVVQAPASFDQTIRGILNLARCNVPVEIRIVLHRHTIARLPQLALYICRNFPFVSHVALMGLEPIGFAKTNYEAIWIDPVDYQSELQAAVDCLTNHRIRTSIYNHPLCLLPPPLIPYSVNSISDWKNIFLPECNSCALNHECGGFFHSASARHSRAIRPFVKA